MIDQALCISAQWHGARRLRRAKEEIQHLLEFIPEQSIRRTHLSVSRGGRRERHSVRAAVGILNPTISRSRYLVMA